MQNKKRGKELKTFGKQKRNVDIERAQKIPEREGEREKDKISRSLMASESLDTCTCTF